MQSLLHQPITYLQVHYHSSASMLMCANGAGQVPLCSSAVETVLCVLLACDGVCLALPVPKQAGVGVPAWCVGIDILPVGAVVSV